MASYNKVLLMGNLTRDVELKYTPNNQAVARIGLAVNRHFRNKEGEPQKETTFVDCDAWGRTAEVMNQYLSKGRPVFIEGHLRLDTWQTQEGENRSKLKVVVENFQFIDSRGSGSESAGSPPADYAPSPARAGGGGEHQPISEDDIPF